MAKKQVAKKKVAEAKVKLFRPDQGVKSFPESQFKNLMANGEWVIPTKKQLGK